MTTDEKQKRLKRYKAIATGLLLLMALVFSTTYFFPETIITGYIRAFSEAAMVGALADWFAVTALFRRPLSLPIPHTNLIETNKQNIGNNLGHFISENFLNAENIRPRIKQLRIAEKVGLWLDKQHNRELLINEITRIASEAITQLDDSEIEALLSRQAKNLLEQIQPGVIAGDTLEGILQKGFHEEWLSLLAENMAKYVEQNEGLIKEKVREGSYKLIPGFVDNLIAGKITKGIQSFLEDFAIDPEHPQRKEINQKLKQLAQEMKTSPEWTNRFQYIKDNLLPEQKLMEYAGQLWLYMKRYFSENLNKHNSGIHRYLNKTLMSISESYLHDETKSRKLDLFVQVQVFKLIMRHREDAARLISSTVSNWESKSLSRKLELEVGKDLQFIRLNGTLVGGIVGLLIYTVSHLLQQF